MADCKIIFLDVDGTITDYENNVPPSAVRAIRLARARGHRVYMCTGRSKAENPPEIWAIGFDGMIGGNGSYVEDAGEVVMHQLITFDQCKRIVDWLHGRGLEFYLESNNGLFASEHFREAARPVLRQYKLGKGATPEEVDGLEVADVLHGIVYGAELYRDDLNKVSFILSSYQDHLDSVEESPISKRAHGAARANMRCSATLGLGASIRPMPCACSWSTSVLIWPTPSPWATPRWTSPCSRRAPRASAWAPAAWRPRRPLIGLQPMWTTTASGTLSCI